ncbi:MAG: amino acid adenylation domain-containing protein, partial [Actinomycetota bacterium]|nr:amino acid adenylation domain-containing protein [Actinomycetota bacterium]
NVDQGTFALRELDVIELPLDSRTAKFDLTLELAEHPGGELGGMLEYATDLFDHETVERLVEHFKTLLASIVAAPEQRVRELELLTEPERRTLLEDWNDTARALPDELLHELLEEQARRTPDASAVRCGAISLRYSELDERANGLAHELRARGVGAETSVGICIERTPDVMVAILGVLKAGGVYVPLDPAMPPDRLAFILEDTQAPIVLVQERTRRHVPAGSHELLSLDEEAAALAARPRHAPARVAGPDNSAYVIYTSGSTGRPKGVIVTNRGLLNYLLWSVEAYEPGLGSGSPAHSSIAFDLTVTAIFPALLVGRTVELVDDPEPGALSRVLQVGGFSLVKITPSHLDLIAQLLPPEQAKDATRRLVAGGEQLLGDALAFWARHAPETLIVNEYGPTETVVGCCYHEARAGDIRPGQLPIGRPISNTLLYVLGPAQELLPVGVPGELYIGGECVARGYLNCPDLTAASFLPDPFASRPGERMYRTGDLVRRRADGNLEHLGRRDDQVKIRGFRIELGEVEAHLASHPRVEDVAVAALEVNEGDKRLVAYVVAPGEGAIPAELRSFLAERLPAELMPSYFVSLDALPLTPNGKLDRRALPAPNARQGVEERVLPRNPAEEAIAAIFAEVLELNEVGVHDGFFDLGGNSLRAMLVVARLRRQFAVEISVPTVFQAQTVADLAQMIAARMAATFHATFGMSPGDQVPEPDGAETTTARAPGEDPPIVPVDRSKPLPLSFAQQRLWFLDQLGEGSP